MQRSGNNSFDLQLKEAFDFQLTPHPPYFVGIFHQFLSEIPILVDLIFQGVAITNSEGFDLPELNLIENIRHSYSTIADTLSLNLSELNTYRSLLVFMYEKRDLVKPFLSDDDSFIDPLRVDLDDQTILRYLALDSSKGRILENSNDVAKLNIPLANKFYDIINPRFHNGIIRKCSESNIILPVYLLKESDRLIVHQLKKKGWPCILQGEQGSYVHHYNDMHNIICKGYAVEDQRTQIPCGQYINEVSLNLSSVFEKYASFTRVSIYRLFPGDSDDISQKYQLLTLFMSLLKKMPDVQDSFGFLSLLIVKEQSNINDHKEVNLLEEFKKKVLKRDRVCESILENLRQYFAHILQSNPKDKKDFVSQVAVRHYNFLVEMSFKYLDYLESHKRYQARCSKITSTMHNTIRNEIETLSKEANETITCIFSLIDDLTKVSSPHWQPFIDILEEAGSKDEDLSDDLIKKLELLVLSKDKLYLMKRFTLFDLEKKGVIKNFSFDKGSKFFDM